MRTLVFGDIHCRSLQLDTLLDLVKPDDDDRIITLGDYVDRGEDSPGVLDRMVNLASQSCLIAIRGNHDQMMLDAAEDEDDLEVWKSIGGSATLDAYDLRSLEGCPASHLSFLRHTCRDSYETDNFIFVHGYVAPEIELAAQKQSNLHWMPVDPKVGHVSGKVIVCGHTPQRDGLPRDFGHAICIDTAGWLTCLELETRNYVQVSDSGEIRRGSLIASPS